MKSLIFILFIFLFITSAFQFKNDKGPKTAEELGKMLFFDKILSKDSSISCASCHKPEFGFADTLAFSKGVGTGITSRNTPSVLNMKFRDAFFWDGRAKTLEEQALGPISNPAEMNLPIKDAVSRLQNNPIYNKAFQNIFKSKVTKELLGKALALYEKTLETGDSPMDKFVMGDSLALTPQEKLGLQLFNGKANCIQCHFGMDMTGDEFRNIGLYDGVKYKDAGRMDVTKKVEDKGKFKVPGLRNVAKTAPYMHDGSFKTLEEIVEYYDNPSKKISLPHNVDKEIKPLNLTQEEKKALVVFLKNGLTATYEY